MGSPRYVSLVWITFADAHPSYCAARWRNGVIAVWTGKVTVDALRRIDAFQETIARTHASYYFVSVNPNGLPFPDSKARRVAGELLKKRDHEALTAIAVLEGDGLFASAGRVVLSSIFTRSTAKDVVCADLVEAARSLAPAVIPGATFEEARLALELVRAESLKMRRATAPGLTTTSQLS
jgi:hypothetical protein